MTARYGIIRHVSLCVPLTMRALSPHPGAVSSATLLYGTFLLITDTICLLATVSMSCCLSQVTLMLISGTVLCPYHHPRCPSDAAALRPLTTATWATSVISHALQAAHKMVQVTLWRRASQVMASPFPDEIPFKRLNNQIKKIQIQQKFIAEKCQQYIEQNTM